MHCVCFEIHPEGSLSHGGVAQPAVIDQWAIQAGISLGPVMELGSVEAIKKVVGAGLGFGVIPRMAVRNLHRGLTAALIVSEAPSRAGNRTASRQASSARLARGGNRHKCVRPRF